MGNKAAETHHSHSGYYSYMCPRLTPHVSYIGENECLFFVKSNSNDVLCIFMGKTMCFFQREVLPQEFLIIGQLNHKRNIKHILQVP